MKHTWQILILAVLVVGLAPASSLFGQNEQHHPQAPLAQPQKAEAPKMCPMAAMMAQREKMEKLVAGLVESFDKVRTLEDPSQRQAAMDEHARLLMQLRDALRPQKAAMTEMMKMCPMMQQSPMHQEQPQA